MIKETLKKMGYEGRGISYGYDGLYHLSFHGVFGFDLAVSSRNNKTYGHLSFYTSSVYKSDRIEQLQDLFNILNIDYKLQLGKPRDREGKEIPLVVETSLGIVNLDIHLFEISNKDYLKDLVEYHRETNNEVHEKLLSELL